MKIIKTNTTPYMGKVLRKVIMSRSAMEKNSYKNRMKARGVFKTLSYNSDRTFIPKKVNG